MRSRHFDEDNEEQPQELSLFEWIERSVDLALQAHGVWNLPVSQTVGEIVKVAEALANPAPGDLRKVIFDPKKMSAVDRDSVIRAIAIYKAVAAEMMGLSNKEMEKKLREFAKELGDD